MKIDVNELKYLQLDESRIPDLLAFQEDVFNEDEEAKETLRRNTYETLKPCFNKESLVLGVYYQEEMIAFGILYFAGEDHENLAYSLDEVPGNIKEYGNVKLIIVKKNYRGNGIQRLLIEKFVDYARTFNYAGLLSTASPLNIPSCKSLERCNFKLAKVVKKYGGLTRNLYFLKLR